VNNPWNLPERQAEILTRLTQGAGTAKQVARELGISFKTVEVHVLKAKKAMGAPTLLQAVLMWDRAQRPEAPCES